MSRKEKKKPPGRRGREPRETAQAARPRKPPSDAVGPLGRDATAATWPFGSRQWLCAAALVFAVFLAYQPAWQGTFLWNDESDVLNNPVLKQGGLAKAWVPGGYLNYWPLTFTVYRIEFEFWGLNPLGFHLVNIALHALSAILVWQILVRLRVPGALLAAALFALHPVNVESVAWITQLKGILSVLLALLSLLFYLLQELRGGRWRYALALVLFLLSALAKGMAITLPVVLLACAWWQRGRIGRQDLLRVIPYLFIGAVMAAMEVFTQHMVAANAVVRDDGLLSRAAVAGCAVWFYLGKLLWPFDLCFVYPRWQIDAQNPLSYVPGALLVALLVLAWWRRRSWGRPVVMLIVCYVGLLLPALGFVNIYFMVYSLVADHWQYAAMIVPCAVFAGVAASLANRGHFPTAVRYGFCLGLLAVLACQTWRQSRMYAGAEELYRTTIQQNPACWMAYNNLGLVLAGHSQVDEAIAQYEAALKIKPDYAEAHINWGTALQSLGRTRKAVTHYQEAVRLDPNSAKAHYNWGNALKSSGRIAEAMAHYQEAVRLNPNYAEAHFNLGNALKSLGRTDEAVTQYQEVLRIDPDIAGAHINLGNALQSLRHFDEAVAQYQAALRLNENDAEVHINLGNALQRSGRLDQAVAHYQEAVRLNPNFAVAHYLLGNALVVQGRLQDAAEHYRIALRLKPDLSPARDNLRRVEALLKQNHGSSN